MFKKLVEVSRTVNKELYSTELEYDFCSSLPEFLAKYSDHGVLKMLQDSEYRAAQEDLALKIKVQVDPDSAPKKTQAKRIVVKNSKNGK
jgi:hypothetical protein